MKKVFIDGAEGTTGLKIFERFVDRKDIELLKINEEKRKDINERKKLINESDYTFLCLPDVAAIEAVSLVKNDTTKIIDASTAHRTNEEWAYGFPELSKEFREKIKNSKRVAVPGCYASGFMACVYPLVESGIISDTQAVYCHAVSGYSGGGKKMIAEYEGKDKPEECFSPRQYALAQNHKHLKEMQKICGLKYKPMFNPIVDDYYNGMVVSLPLILRTLNKEVTIEDIHNIYKEKYSTSNFVKVMELQGDKSLINGFLPSNTLKDTNQMQIFVCGDEEQVLVAARFDNLGKGASGAAVQCMNIMMDIDETTGLI